MYQGLVLHHIPGRMRLRLPFLKGFSASPDQLKELILPLPGIKQVELNPITGSALISYDAEQYDTFLDQLAEYVKNAWGLTLTASDATLDNNHGRNGHNYRRNGHERQESDAARLLINSFKRLNAEVREMSENGADLKVILPVSLAACALLKMGSTATTPLWVTLGLFSFTSFVSLHPSALEESDDNKKESDDNKKRKKRRSKDMSNSNTSS
jgi:hypothetical protein